MKDQKDTLTGALLPLEAPKRGRGRPAQHADAAAKQKAYRERLKARGLREVRMQVRDVRGASPLRSDILDLSEVRHPAR